MPDAERTVYLDSGVIISYLAEHPDRVGTIASAFAQAERLPTKLRLITSTLSVVEVAYGVNQSGVQFPENDLESIELCWERSPVLLVEASRVAMRYGHDFLRRRAERVRQGDLPDTRARSVDAAHIGTVEWLAASELWTYDGTLLKLNDITPSLDIREPWSDQLPLDID